MGEQLTVYEPGDRFVATSAKGEAHVYEVAEDGRAYVRGWMPDEQEAGR